MKINFSFILLYIILAINAYALDEIEVSSIDAIHLRVNSLGDAEISIKAEVCNNGERGKVYATVAGYDFNGYELADKMFAGVVLDSRECRILTDTMFIESGRYLNIREWKTKETVKYRAK
jgi:hypothetical protein